SSVSGDRSARGGRRGVRAASWRRRRGGRFLSGGGEGRGRGGACGLSCDGRQRNPGCPAWRFGLGQQGGRGHQGGQDRGGESEGNQQQLPRPTGSGPARRAWG